MAAHNRNDAESNWEFVQLEESGTHKSANTDAGGNPATSGKLTQRTDAGKTDVASIACEAGHYSRENPAYLTLQQRQYCVV